MADDRTSGGYEQRLDRLHGHELHGVPFGALLPHELAAIPTTKALALLALAGVANGIGMVAYTRLITDQQFGMSSYAPAALTLMVVFVTIVGALFFHEPFPVTKFLGLCLACAGTWLMVK